MTFSYFLTRVTKGRDKSRLRKFPLLSGLYSRASFGLRGLFPNLSYFIFILFSFIPFPFSLLIWFFISIALSSPFLSYFIFLIPFSFPYFILPICLSSPSSPSSRFHSLSLSCFLLLPFSLFQPPVLPLCPPRFSLRIHSSSIILAVYY